MKQILDRFGNRRKFRTFAAVALAIVAASLLGKAMTISYAAPAPKATPTPTPTPSGPQTWVVAFQNANGLPNNVDTLVANAGGQTLVKIPEIGGLAATSSNPNFGANMVANVQVKTADIAMPTLLIDPIGPSEKSSTNNGGTAQPTGS
ncbi:MAG: hypothetical protein JWO45_624, partial [Spartobacteria bacterium]|nr:hypothetical protein [Spartobacteria bacterium]